MKSDPTCRTIEPRVYDAKQPIILDDIPFSFDEARLMKKLHIREDSGMENDFRTLCGEVCGHAGPRAVIRPCYVDERGEDYVVIQGVIFRSRVLRINLDEAERVFLMCATCGMELYDWGRCKESLLERFWAESIQELAMQQAIDYTRNYIAETFNPGPLGLQNPGSLEDWPLEEQKKLFHLIGDTESAIGVKLLESSMIVPLHSLSGVFFPTEVDFVNCLLCPRKKCPSRRAAFNEELSKNHYRLS